MGGAYSAAMRTLAGGALPCPRRQFADALCRVIREPRENLGEPGLWVDVVEATGLDKRVDRRCATPSFIGSREGPVAAPHGDVAQGPFRGVVRQADSSIVEEAGEGRPAGEHVADRLGDLVLGREPPQLFSANIAFSERDVLALRAVLANGAALVGQPAVDAPLDGKQFVDAPYDFKCRSAPSMSLTYSKMSSLPKMPNRPRFEDGVGAGLRSPA